MVPGIEGFRPAGALDGAPRTRRGPGRAIVIALLAGLVATVGCAQPEPEEEPAVELADTTEDALPDVEEDTLPDIMALADTAPPPRFDPPGSFPHGEHRAIECETCHDDVDGHGTHAEVACTECHGTPEGYGELPVRTERDCMTCHHEEVVGRECGECHRVGEVGPRRVTQSLAFADAAAIERPLPFEHATHEAQTCATCHTGSVMLTVERECASCHEDHHRPDAQCGSCHDAGTLDSHDAAAHQSCSGSGCHMDPVVNALPPNRTLCLSCHAAQSDHEEGEDCIRCHLVAPSRTGADGGGAR